MDFLGSIVALIQHFLEGKGDGAVLTTVIFLCDDISEDLSYLIALVYNF
jgi:hypothetical protein